MSWVLVVLIYTVTDGHRLSDASYRDRIELGPFQTQADCERARPHVRFNSFPRASDLSYDLHQTRCEKVTQK